MMEKIEIVYKKEKIWGKIKGFIVTHFFPIRCHACRCIDCQLGEYGRKYWNCPHLKKDICSLSKHFVRVYPATAHFCVGGISCCPRRSHNGGQLGVHEYRKLG